MLSALKSPQFLNQQAKRITSPLSIHFFLQTRRLPFGHSAVRPRSFTSEETGGFSVAADRAAIYIPTTINTKTTGSLQPAPSGDLLSPGSRANALRSKHVLKSSTFEMRQPKEGFASFGLHWLKIKYFYV